MNVNTGNVSPQIESRFSRLAVPIQKKKFVFITARIHPGETNSSYMMRGLLEFITSDDKIAQVMMLIYWRKKNHCLLLIIRNYVLS